jgi:hypothetical protein
MWTMQQQLSVITLGIAELARSRRSIATASAGRPCSCVRGYVADPDHHAWEIAWNPAWPISPEGYVQSGPT